jgi:hypothetical protein
MSLLLGPRRTLLRTSVVAAAPESSYVGPGDVVSGATAYWGLRGYNGAYAAPGTNPGIDIVKASDGSASQTINILNDGSLDVATIGGLGYAVAVSKMYDQVGTNHLVQATLADMPTLSLAFVGTRPAMLFTPSQGFTSGSGITRAQPFTMSSYVRVTNANSAVQFVFTGNSNLVYFQADFGNVPGPIGPDMNAGADVFTTGVAVPAWFGFQTVFNGASSDLNINGTALVGNAGATGFSAETLHVGWSSTADAGLNGYMTEIGLWPSAFAASGDSDDMYTNQSAWWA